MKKYLIGFIVGLLVIAGNPAIPFFHQTTVEAAKRPNAPSGSNSSSSQKPSASATPKPSAPTPSTPPVIRRPNAPTGNSNSGTSGSTSVNPNQKAASVSSSGGTSAKPGSNSYDSAAASDKKRQESQKAYDAAHPSQSNSSNYSGSSGTYSGGSSRSSTPTQTQSGHISSLSQSDYQNRSVRVTNHYHTYYGSRYDYYRSQPTIYIGGGYSSIFWYSMMDWDAQRRAQWLYNHQYDIDQSLYQQQLRQNAQLAGIIAGYQQQGIQPNRNYVDPEYQKDPDVMYDDNFVNANYNHQVPAQHSGHAFLYITLGFLIAVIFIWLVFIKNWDAA